MNETIYPGGQIMIRIDGSKIRRIREQKGLTQLYVATAVDVTTDTVSRWENRRYPSIKHENGVKLAQALEVELDDILESEEDTTEPGPTRNQVQRTESPSPVAANSQLSDHKKTLFSFQKSAAILVLSSIFVISSITLVFFFYFKGDYRTNIMATRTVSSHFVAGRPVPVFIKITGVPDNDISIILRENLPPGTELSTAIPKSSNSSKNDRAVKWLNKISGPTIFSYSIKTEETYQGTLRFEGILKVGSSNDKQISVSGNSSSASSFYHWADTNRDNRISDEEILMVYDLTGPEGITGIDMDLLEEIWLGEGYIWQPEKQTFSILE